MDATLERIVGANGAPERLVVADDDPVVRTILTRAARSWHFEPVEVEDGRRALAALQAEDGPRMALLDWGMPGLDGLEVCRVLKHGEDTPSAAYLILLTDRNDPESAVEGLEAGADDFIVKPFNRGELEARLNAGRRVVSLQRALSRQDRLKGALELAATVCHEMNQPLQVVNMWVEMLEAADPDEPMDRETLGHIRGGVESIARLTRRLMGLTHYRSRDYLRGGARIVDLAADPQA